MLALGPLILTSLLGWSQTSHRSPYPAGWGDFRIDDSLMVESGSKARHRMRRMRPKFITIHSTANKAKGADARTHARGQRNGSFKSTHNSLGFLSWHFTVDQGSVYQSLPDTEQGQHADYEGQGNRESIGIEMCENAGNDTNRTIDRTAKLTAVLMKRHRIPIDRVVPHQHWRRIRFADKKDLGFKNCPGMLLENNQLGSKWRRFLAATQHYHRQL